MVVSTEQANRAISSASQKVFGCRNNTVLRASGRNPWTKYPMLSTSKMFNRQNLFVYCSLLTSGNSLPDDPSLIIVGKLFPQGIP